MSIIQLHWNILKQEDRALKSILDLSKIQYKLVAVPYDLINKSSPKSNTTSPQNNIASRSNITCPQSNITSPKSNIQTIYNLNDLIRLTTQHPSLNKLLGATKQQTQQIYKYLELYQVKFKHSLNISLYNLISSSIQSKIPLINAKFIQFQSSIKEIQFILSHNQHKFICSQSISIIDVVLYFHVCNLVYFGKNHHHYPIISKWFVRVYKIKEIRIVTHQWFSMAKQISPLLNVKKIAKPKL